jgi:hypothetical protein
VQVEGIFERLKRLRVELLPNSVPEALQQYQLASPPADEKEKYHIANIANTTFDMIKDKKPLEDIEEYLNANMVKPKVMTDNRYNLFLLKLLKTTIKVFRNRLDYEFTRRPYYSHHDPDPRRSSKDKYQWSEKFDMKNGALVKCVRAIGIIQFPVPRRVKKLFRVGIGYLLNDKDRIPDDPGVFRKLQIDDYDPLKSCRLDWGGGDGLTRKGEGPKLGDSHWIEDYINQCIRQSKLIRTQSMDKSCCLVM